MKHYQKMNRSEKAIESRLRKELKLMADSDTVEYYEDIILQLKKEIERLNNEIARSKHIFVQAGQTITQGYDIPPWAGNYSVSSSSAFITRDDGSGR